MSGLGAWDEDWEAVGSKSTWERGWKTLDVQSTPCGCGEVIANQI